MANVYVTELYLMMLTAIQLCFISDITVRIVMSRLIIQSSLNLPQLFQSVFYIRRIIINSISLKQYVMDYMNYMMNYAYNMKFV